MKALFVDHHYVDNGALQVLLVGVSKYECSKCGYSEIEVPRVEDLHLVLRRTIAERTERLSGPEIRFLRKSLGWSGNDLADLIGVSRETISRWETSHREIPQPAERLLRLLVMTKSPKDDYLDKLRASGTEPTSPKSIRIVRDGNLWRQDHSSMLAV